MGLSLAPWVQAMFASPDRLPVSDSTVGHGLLALTPVLQGAGHWLRFAAVGMNRSMVALDFSALGGPAFESIGLPLLVLRALLSAATMTLAAWANVLLWRRPEHRWARLDASASARRWLEGVIRWSFLAALIVFALSPIGVSGHALLSVVHLAVLPVVLAIAPRLSAGRRRGVLMARAYAVGMVVLGAGLVLGAPAYRCGGFRGLTAHFQVAPLAADHRMFDELGVHRTCALVVDDPDGWWPDGLRPPPPDAAVAWDRARLDTRDWLRTSSDELPGRTAEKSAGGAQR